MEAACYILDLYCDDPDHYARHPNKIDSLDAQYTGETYGECKKQARADGWKWVTSRHSGNTLNICKRCAEHV